jgi:hypothetical protein
MAPWIKNVYPQNQRMNSDGEITLGIKIPAASCGVFRRGEVVRSPQAAGNQTLRDSKEKD